MKWRIILAVLVCLLLVSVASARTVVDDFEDGDIAEYVGDTGSFDVVTSLKYNGDYALKGLSSAVGARIYSTSGLNVYPQQGDNFTFYFRTNGSTAGDAGSGAVFFGGTDSDNCYRFTLNPAQDEFELAIRQGGSPTTLNNTMYSFPADIWYRSNINWEQDGTITATVYYASNGTQIGQISAVNNTYTDGGFGWMSHGGSNNVPKFFDYAYLPQPSYNVSGYAHNTTDSPIHGVDVETNTTTSTTTDSNGYWKMSLTNGTYNITASKFNTNQSSQIVTVDGADVTGVNFTLEEYKYKTIAITSDHHYGNTEGDGASDDNADAVNFIKSLNPDYLFVDGDVIEGDSDNANVGRETQWDWFYSNYTALADNITATMPLGSIQEHHLFGGKKDALMLHALRDSKNAPIQTYEIGNIAVIVGVSDGLDVPLISNIYQYKEKKLINSYEDRGFNTILIQHKLLNDTVIWSDDMAGMDDANWQQTSKEMKQMFRDTDLDIFIAAHAHVDPQTTYSGATITDGLIGIAGEAPNTNTPNTTHIQMACVDWEHGGYFTTDDAEYPSVTVIYLVQGKSNLKLKHKRVDTNEWVDTKVNNTPKLVRTVDIPVDHPVDIEGVNETASNQTREFLPYKLWDEGNIGVTWLDKEGFNYTADNQWMQYAWSWEPMKYKVPSGVSLDYNTSAGSISTSVYWSENVSNTTSWQSYNFNTTPIKAFMVNTTPTVTANEMHLYNITPEYKLEFWNSNPQYHSANDTYTFKTIANNAKTHVNLDSKLEYSTKMKYRVKMGVKAELGNVTVSAVDDRTDVWPSTVTGNETYNFTANTSSGSLVEFNVTGLSTSKNYTVQRSQDGYYWNGSGWQSSQYSITASNGYIEFNNTQWSNQTFNITPSVAVGPCGYTSGDWRVTSPTVCKQDVQVDAGHRLICEDTLTMLNATVTADGFESRTTVPLVCAEKGTCAVFS